MGGGGDAPAEKRIDAGSSTMPACILRLRLRLCFWALWSRAKRALRAVVAAAVPSDWPTRRHLHTKSHLLRHPPQRNPEPALSLSASVQPVP